MTTDNCSWSLPIILGSSSQFRQEVMRELKLPFRVMKPDIDEKAIVVESGQDRTRSDPKKLVLAIAKAKASALLPLIKEPSLLITCDQVIHYKDTIREKPTSKQQCREYLASYVDYPAITCSSVVVTNTQTGKQVEGVDIAKQYFKPIPKDIVDTVLAKGDIMHCAGGFMVDDPILHPYLSAREGDQDSIIGLPKKLLLRLLQEASQ